MQRREFLAASTAATLGLIAPSLSRGAEGGDANRELIEVRTYQFASPQKQEAYEKFLAEAGIAAFNRSGVEPVGVLKLFAKENPTLRLSTDSTDLRLVLPFKSFQSYIELDDKLAEDQAYEQAGKEILNDAQKNPSYVRYESTLLYTFPHFPRVEVPTKSPDRVLQLRRYESHNRERARKKVDMFDTGGEIAIFKRCGMNGVFFGEALAGVHLPSLTYMLAFENMDAQKKGWAAFGRDSGWKDLNADKQYKETVMQGTIMNLLLRPAAGSQI
jgi:hypothetical protein